MPEEVIRYDDVVNQSIAEMNLIEQLTKIIDPIEREASRLLEMSKSLVEGKNELVKKAYEYIRKTKEEAQNLKETTMEYIVRLTPSLINKEIYIMALSHLDKLSQLIDEIAYKMTLVARMNIEIDRGLGDKIDSMISKMYNMVKDLQQESKQLGVNPRKALAYHDEICSGESEIDEAYREAEISTVNSSALGCLEKMVLKELIETIENTADTIRDASYDFKYLALYRV